ncbi:TIGR01212 family radical SAM protein [Hydrogenimonas sp. SS33]|uniref:TIGR01212 family radical SAM protein n=1 Tax=Hydrogenimonas leucolamina TaxID=2954236 RepID=UPI00336C2EFA
MKKVYTIGRYFRKKFGFDVYKVPLSIAGFTCPNIDGTVAKGGCTFCLNESFSPNLAEKTARKFYLHPDNPENPLLQKQLEQVRWQYEATRARLHGKYGVEHFLAYFQSFTNTYAPLETLKALYEEALRRPGCIGLSIGTRSDSVSDEILDYLADLSKSHEIWVEYGIQSVYDETLEKINRGHDSANVETWIRKTREKGLKVCGHVIFGLPGETEEMMLETVRSSIEWGIDAIKIHPLYVVKNTALAADYLKGRFTPIDEATYIRLLVESVKMLPRNIAIQRVTAGINDDTLLAPEWCRCKHTQMKHIRQALKEAGYLY